MAGYGAAGLSIPIRQRFLMNNGRRGLFAGSSSGSITLEAALVLPLFLAFVLAMVSLVRISTADAQLQHAVSETTRQVSAHAYPVMLASDEFNGSGTGQTIQEFIGKLRMANEEAKRTGGIADRYSNFIPEPLYVLLEWIQAKRENAVQFADKAVNRMLCTAFKPLLMHYAGDLSGSKRIVKASDVTVTGVSLPSLTDSNDAFFGIEAQVEVKLPIPFFHSKVRIVKKSTERLWIGQ